MLKQWSCHIRKYSIQTQPDSERLTTPAKKNLSCIYIIHLDEYAFNFSKYVVLIVHVNDTAEVQCLNNFWICKHVILWTVQASITSFSSEKSHWRYLHSSEMCFSLYWQHKVCVECVFARWAVRSPVWNKWCHALNLTVPATLPCVSELFMLPWQQPWHHPLTSASRLRISFPQGNFLLFPDVCVAVIHFFGAVNHFNNQARTWIA